MLRTFLLVVVLMMWRMQIMVSIDHALLWSDHTVHMHYWQYSSTLMLGTNSRSILLLVILGCSCSCSCFWYLVLAQYLSQVPACGYAANYCP